MPPEGAAEGSSWHRWQLPGPADCLDAVAPCAPEGSGAAADKPPSQCLASCCRRYRSSCTCVVSCHLVTRLCHVIRLYGRCTVWRPQSSELYSDIMPLVVYEPPIICTALRMQGCTGLQLAPWVLRALEGMELGQRPDQVRTKANARRHEQAGACLATAAGAQAVQSLRAAAEARKNSGSMACTSGRPDSSMSAGDSSSAAPAGSRSSPGSSWGRVQQLSEEAVDHMESLLHAEELHSSVRSACLASLAPTSAELRFLAALQGQHEQQASLDRLCADSWSQHTSPAYFHSALGGCQLLQILCPELTASVPSLSGQLSGGQTGQQLRSRAADTALEPMQEPWRAQHRGLLHLLAAAQLQREGESSCTSHTESSLAPCLPCDADALSVSL